LSFSASETGANPHAITPRGGSGRIHPVRTAAGCDA